MMNHDEKESGFTLIEILIALVIVAVGVLALAGFNVNVLSNNEISRERLTAVHLAEQVLEFWQNDAADRPPNIAAGTCTLSARAANPAAYPVTTSCTPDAGVGISYTIAANTSPAQAPLPASPNNSFGTTPPTVGQIANMEGKNGIVPMIKVVTVSWSNKGTARSVYLTHITRMP